MVQENMAEDEDEAREEAATTSLLASVAAKRAHWGVGPKYTVE